MATADAVPTPIHPYTLLPLTFTSPSTASLSTHLKITAELVDLRQVDRRQAALRSGPGIIYPLLDVFLKEGDEVIAFEAMGPWRKVISLATHQKGWLHEQAMSARTITPGDHALPRQLFPRVFAVRDVSRAYEFLHGKAMPVRVPKGTGFALLKSTADKNLVLIDATSSVAWMDRKDVQ